VYVQRLLKSDSLSKAFVREIESGLSKLQFSKDKKELMKKQVEQHRSVRA